MSSVVGVIHDIQADVIPSFSGRSIGAVRRRRAGAEIQIQVERPDDRPDFADDVVALLAEQDPALAPRLVSVADTQGAAAEERRRFFAARPLDATGPEADELLRSWPSMAPRRRVSIERSRSPRRRASVQPARSSSAGSAPAFVYVPIGPGLVVRPGGATRRRPCRRGCRSERPASSGAPSEQRDRGRAGPRRDHDPRASCTGPGSSR